jgi:restriction system protein
MTLNGGGIVDLGADLLGNDPDGRSVAVQCKRYAPGNKVASKEMQLFIGMQRVQHGTERGIYVTTSEFTSAARDLGNRHGIWLINGSELVKLQRGPKPEAGKGRSWFGGLAESFR